MSATILSLCTGMGGLDLAVEAVTGARTVAVCDNDPGASKVLAHRFSHVPNLGDLKTIDWHEWAGVEVMTAGYPCQPFSHAGKRAGTDDPRHIWPDIAKGIAIVRPRLCLFENVRGHLSLGFDEVVRDLHLLGYDVHWCTLRAADVGACHGRSRLFILAEDRNGERILGRSDRRGGLHRDTGDRRLLPGAAQGFDVRQGSVGPTDAGEDARGEAGDLDRWQERTQPGHVHLEDHGSGCIGGDRAASTPVASEGAGCGHCARVPENGGRLSATPKWACNMDRRNALPGRDAQEQDPRGQPAGTRPNAARIAAGDPSGCIPPRVVVGADGRPVRSSRVHGEPSDGGPDDRGSCLRASDVGACHRRERLFIVATPADAERRGRDGRAPDSRRRPLERAAAAGRGEDAGEPLVLLKTPTAQLAVNGGSQHPDKRKSGGHGPTLADEVEHLLPTPTTRDHKGRNQRDDASCLTGALVPTQGWSVYEAAIRRHEAMLGRSAPPPTETGPKGGRRLSPRFVEWMMGLPAGWVTDVPGLTRNEQLKALGNGVVVQQCAAALTHLLGIQSERVA